MGEGLFLADGGLETTLIFHDRIDLPDFNAFPLLADAAGSALLRKYYRAYAQIAQRHRTGLVLESATWRARPFATSFRTRRRRSSSAARSARAATAMSPRAACRPTKRQRSTVRK